MSTTITKKDTSLLEYIQSGEIDNEENISEWYTNVEDLIKSMKLYYVNQKTTHSELY